MSSSSSSSLSSSKMYDVREVAGVLSFAPKSCLPVEVAGAGLARVYCFGVKTETPGVLGAVFAGEKMSLRS